MQKLPLDVVPPIAGVAALAALTAIVLNQLIVFNQLVLSALAGATRVGQFPKLAHAAHFATNLSVTAGLITLISCVSWVLLDRPRQALPAQIIVFVAASVLFHVALSALLFDPLTASRAQIYFGVAAANLIGICVGIAALSCTHGKLLRTIAFGIVALAALNLASVVIDLGPDMHFDPWISPVIAVFKGLVELVYLVMLLATVPLVVPRGVRLRSLFARSVGLAVLVLSAVALWNAQRTLNADYSLLLYSAQRVALLIDWWPLGYAVPFCISVAAAITGLLSGGGIRLQAASGMLLIFAAGHAARAPGRLLSLCIGFVLLSRALVALTEHAPFRSLTPPPPTPRNTRRPRPVEEPQAAPP
jgi:hypothetical protein